MEKEQTALATELGGPVFSLTVRRVISETRDACSLVFDIPEKAAEAFRYRAGQFLTLRIPYDGKILSRCYSLASSPDTDSEHKITVKRVEHGRISNWLNDEVEAGDRLSVMPPGGVFVLDGDANDVALFAAGSGITPIISLAKSALATTRRRVHLVYANRDRDSVIFASELDYLCSRHGDRFRVKYSFDDTDGLLDIAAVRTLVAGQSAAECYVCGPAIFMSTVERALLEEGVPESNIHIERFVSPPDPDENDVNYEGAVALGSMPLVVYLDGVRHEVPWVEGQTILVASQQAGLRPPFSCTEAFCGCCMARLQTGKVHMRKNDFLSRKEVEQGWVLTCQSVPITTEVEVRYP